MSSAKYWALADQATQSATNFATMVLAARTMDAAHFAMFSLAYLATLFVLSFHRTWITQPMNVLGSLSPNTLGHRARALFRGHVAVIPLGMAMILAIAPLGFPLASVAFTAAVYLAFYLFHEFFRRFAYSTGNVRRAALASVAVAALQFTVIVTLTALEQTSPAKWMVALAVSQIVGIVVVGWGRPLGKGAEDYSASMAVLSEHWVHSRWVIASQVVFWLSSQAYPFLLTRTDAITVATFNAGVSVLNAGNVVRLTLANYLPAQIGRVRKEQGNDGVSSYARRVILLIVAACGIAWPILFIVAEPVINLLYGGKFAAAEAVLTWGALGLFASMVSVVLNAVALVVHKTRGIFVSNAIGAAFTCTVGVALIARFGINGAIVGTIIGYLIPATYQFFQLRTTLFGTLR